MCGIIAAFNADKKNKPVNKFIIEQFEDQAPRGKEGFGLIRISPDKVEIDRATETCKFLLDLYQNPSAMIIAHHRTPTSTPNKMSQTHPIFVSNKILNHDYLIIHNGIIYNAAEMKGKHEKLGFVYQTEIKAQKEDISYTYYYRCDSFNDSEALAIETALIIEEKIKESDIRGSQAFIALQIDKKTQKPLKVFFGRKNNPLNLLKEKGSIKLSSEGPGEEIKESTLYSFNTSDKNLRLTKTKMKFTPIIEEKKEEPKNKTTELQTEKKQKMITNEVTDYFKESIQNKPAEEIEEMAEEMLEMSETEIMDTLAEMRSEVSLNKDTKTGEFKKRICLALDEIRSILIIAETEMAVAQTGRIITETFEKEELANDFINWKKDTQPYLETSHKEHRGQEKIKTLGF